VENEGKRKTIQKSTQIATKHLIKALQDKGYANIAIADLPEYNLIKSDDVKRLYENTKPDIVIHHGIKNTPGIALT
jgi:dTDP-4-dehydrorhamnose reductase